MASPFAITTASNTVLLNDKRQGQVTFTVNNISGRPLRGRARLVPQNPAVSDWLKIGGDAERDLTIAGTQQYPVQVSVPPQAAAGNYTFRLDMVAVDNPDEDFTQGPSVTFQAPPPKVAGFPWWILLVVLALLVLVGGGVALAWHVISGTPTPTATATEVATPTPPSPEPTRLHFPTLRFTIGPARPAPRPAPMEVTPAGPVPRPPAQP